MSSGILGALECAIEAEGRRCGDAWIGVGGVELRDAGGNFDAAALCEGCACAVARTRKSP